MIQNGTRKVLESLQWLYKKIRKYPYKTVILLILIITASIALFFKHQSNVRASELRVKAEQLQTTEQQKKDVETKLEQDFVPKTKLEEEIKKKDEEIEKIKLSKAQEKANLASASIGGISLKLGSSTGNGYQPGQCVWFVKQMRPELPNSWGSAITWFSRAQAQGWPTGTTPKVNAVGWRGNHVVLITAVNGNTVTYKDMNGRYIPFEIGTGTRPANYYKYIY